MTRINNSVNNISGSLTTTKTISGYSLPISKYYTSTMSASAQSLTTSFAEIPGLSLTLPQQGIYEITTNIREDLSSVTTSVSANNFSLFKLNYPSWVGVLGTGGGSILNKNIASSSDGSKVAHLGYYVSTSNDYGDTWTQRTFGATNTRCITSSSDGLKLALCGYTGTTGYIYTSTDGGVNFNVQAGAGTLAFSGICSSTDGAKLAACVYGGYIWTSTNSGVNWAQRTNSGSSNWLSIACSDNGSTIVAADYNGYVSVSYDSGSTWTSHTEVGFLYWKCATCSADGTKMAICSVNTNIWISTNSGVNWIQKTNSGIKAWNSVSYSRDGSVLVASTNNEYFYISLDDGNSWTAVTELGAASWFNAILTSNNEQMLVGHYNGVVKNKYWNDDSLINTNTLGSQISKLTSPIIYDSTKIFTSIINNRTNNAIIKTFSKINNPVTGSWQIKSDKNGESTMTARLIG